MQHVPGTFPSLVPNVSAVILMGGHSKRMGRDKALLPFEGETFISIIVRKLSALSDDVWIVGRPDQRHPLVEGDISPSQFTQDRFEDCGPLGGLHAGLVAMRHEVGFVVACDMPLISVELLRHMAGRLDMGYEAVIPKDANGWHPLHAVYRRSCIEAIERMIRVNDLRVQNLIKQLNVRAVEADEMVQFDPQKLSLKNLNTPNELEALKALGAL
jgi:molybdopterin-guanine dinucleotide biosynthesis protein A